MFYIDTNVFAFAILNEPEEKMAKPSIGVLSKIVDGEIRASTSFLTWDELAWTLRKRIGTEAANAEAGKFLRFPSLKFLDVNESVMMYAQGIAEQYSIKPRDAIHAATALLHGAEMISDDPDFDAVKELKRIPTEKFKI